GSRPCCLPPKDGPPRQDRLHCRSALGGPRRDGDPVARNRDLALVGQAAAYLGGELAYLGDHRVEGALLNRDAGGDEPAGGVFFESSLELGAPAVACEQG